MTRRWALRRQWIERGKEAAQVELSRVERTVRLAVGRALLDWVRQPWRIVTALRAVAKALRSDAVPIQYGSELDSARPPLPLEIEPDYPTAAAADAHRAELAAAWEAVERLTSSTEYRLGSALVAPVPWRQRLRVAADVLRRAGPTPMPRRSGAANDPIRPGPFTCLGPAWFEEMLAYDAVPSLRRGATGSVLLVGVDGKPEPGLNDAVAAAHSAGRRVVLWFLEEARAGDLAPDGVERVYSALPDGREHLPPAVAPQLHNPIGWWSGVHGIEAAFEAEMPDAWRRLVGVARGLPSAADVTFGATLPEVSPPAWSADGADWQRFARLRHVLENETLEDRLARVADDLGLPRSRELPRVSLEVATNRRQHLDNLFDNVARQHGRPIELALVLHGLPQLVAELRDRAAARGIDARIQAAPTHWRLVDCRRQAAEIAGGDVRVRMDDDDWYGPRYAADLALALSFSGAGVATKITSIIHFADAGRTVVTNPGWEFRYRPDVFGSALAMRREVLQEVLWRGPGAGGDYRFFQDLAAAGIPALSADRFNFVYMRYGTNTWSPSSSTLLKHLPHLELPAAARWEDFQP